MKKFWGLLFIPSLSFACPSLEEAATLYRSGQRARAVEALRCVKQNNPKQAQELRLLISDYLWWDGQAELSNVEIEEFQRESDPSSRSPLPPYLFNRLTKFRLRSGAERVSSAGNDGTEYNFGGSYRYFRKNQIDLSYARKVRVYNGSESLRDSLFKIGHVWAMTPKIYFESSAQFAADPLFSAKTIFHIEAHYVFQNEIDLALGVQKSRYTDATVNTLTPYLAWPLTEWFNLSLRGYMVVFHKKFYNSAKLDLGFKLHERLGTNLAFSTGNSFEDPTHQEPFTALGAGVKYQIINPLFLNAQFGFHRGQRRKERLIGLGVEWHF